MSATSAELSKYFDTASPQAQAEFLAELAHLIPHNCMELSTLAEACGFRLKPFAIICKDWVTHDADAEAFAARVLDGCRLAGDLARDAAFRALEFIR